MATPLRNLLGGIWQRVKGFFGRFTRREEEPAEDEWPDQPEPFEDDEPKRTLSGELPEQAAPLATDWGQAEEVPRVDRPDLEDEGDAALRQSREEPDDSEPTYTPSSLEPQETQPPTTTEAPKEPAEDYPKAIRDEWEPPESDPTASEGWFDETPQRIRPPARVPRRDESTDHRTPQTMPPEDVLPTTPEATPDSDDDQVSQPVMLDPQDDTPDPADVPDAAEEDAPEAAVMPDGDQGGQDDTNDGGDWDDTLNAIYKQERRTKRPQSDPIEERRARVRQREWTKRQARRGRLGLPMERPPLGRQKEETDDAPSIGTESGVSGEMPPETAGSDETELEEAPLGRQGGRPPPKQQAIDADVSQQLVPLGGSTEREPVDPSQQNKEEGITNRQATELISLLVKIERHTEETKTVMEGVQDSIEVLIDLIPTLGTMSQ